MDKQKDNPSLSAKTTVDDGIDENGLTLSAIILAGFTFHFFSMIWKQISTRQTVGSFTVLHDEYPVAYRCSLAANTIAFSASLLIILLRITGWLRFKPGTFLWEMRALLFVGIISLAALFLSSTPLFYA